MYAIFENGSHQYRVSPGDTITLDHRPGVNDGDEVVFDKVLLVVGPDGARIGMPTVEGARVVGQLVRQFRGKKIIIQKFRRRKNMRRRRGHRQRWATVQVTDVSTGA